MQVSPFIAECEISGFDYDQLVNDFGCVKISQQLLDKFQRITGNVPHLWLRRNIFFAHRDLDKILDDYEQGKKIFLYTGRGPSSESMHLGHLLPFYFTKYLQDAFNAFVIIQIADDEKRYFKKMSLDTIQQMIPSNVRDIIACGFNPERTFIFNNHNYLLQPSFNNMIHNIYGCINSITIQQIFGLGLVEDNPCTIGQLVWPVYQTAASFSKSFTDIFGDNNIRCLVAYAIDQDPYFRLSRDVA